jgi:hypothetical protein
LSPGFPRDSWVNIRGASPGIWLRLAAQTAPAR